MTCIGGLTGHAATAPAPSHYGLNRSLEHRCLCFWYRASLSRCLEARISLFCGHLARFFAEPPVVLNYIFAGIEFGRAEDT
jgi:hypothetical protein